MLSARNAAKINEEHLNRLLLDHMINEREIQIAAFAQNSRDSKDPNTIIWRPLYLIKQNGKVDFRVRENRLRWFQFSALKKLLMKNDFDIDACFPALREIGSKSRSTPTSGLGQLPDKSESKITARWSASSEKL